MKEILLSQGKVALVDDEDFEYLSQWKWSAIKSRKTFYAIRTMKRDGKWVTVSMHRVILEPLSNMCIDHIDHNGLNNQRSNIRVATRRQNMVNRTAWGRSKYLGVCIYYHHSHKYITAHIRVGGLKKYLGTFLTEEDAALAYNEAAREHHGEYAKLNIVDT